MKRLLGLIGLIGLLSGISMLPTVAQNPEWEAWMYNSDNGRMVLIGNDNVVYEDFILPGLQANDYSWRVSISPDGTKIAYSLFNTFTYIYTIHVYSTVTDTIIATYAIPSQQGQLTYQSLEFNPSSQIFSPDSTSLAFGYTIEDTWSLVVMDIASQPGQIVLQLNETDPAMSNVEQIGFDVPTVIRYDGTNIDFEIIPGGTEGFPSYPHYTYNRQTGTLIQNYYLTVPGGDFNARDGRYVFNISDFRLPNNSLNYQGFGDHINALHMWVPNTTQTYPIFNAPNHSLFRPTFIQNGEKILMQANDWINLTNEWWTIDQASQQPTVITTLGDVFPIGLEGVGDGMVMSISSNDVVNIFPDLQNLPDRTVLLYFDTRASANGSAVQQMWLGGENRNFKLVWAHDNQADSRPIVGQWGAIGAPVDASNYTTLAQGAGQTSSPSGNLQIGGQARIFTTEGDRANMRSGPGTNFSVVEQLANDTIVTVLEGPQSDGTLTWWRVETASNSGWVVESAEGVRVLQPFGNIIAPASSVSGSNTLAVGGQAIVTADGNNLNARQQANTSASVVVILRTGEVLTIVGGPTTGEGFTWWQVSTPNGRAWVAEGTADTQWIVPAG